jgi:hypothetical protein
VTRPHQGRADSEEQTDWRSYERGLLERLRYDFPEPDFRVEGTVSGRPHRVRGRLSQTRRQLDAAVYRSGESTPFLIADATFHARPIDVKEVEAFIGLIKDVGAILGGLAAPKGGSNPARRRAETAGVRVEIMSLDEAITFRWYPVAREIFLHDWIFHEKLARALRALKTDGCARQIEGALEDIAFEEWEAYVRWALGHHPEEGVSFLVWVARHHYDDGWVYNATRILDEVGLMPPELRAELLGRVDEDLHEFLVGSEDF